MRYNPCVQVKFVLGAVMEAWVDDQPRGIAPNESVAALAQLLLDANGRPILRKESATRLYPQSKPEDAANAFRQTLFRLKQWLGENAIQTTRTILQAAGEWTLESPDGAAAIPPISYTHRIFTTTNTGSKDKSTAEILGQQFSETIRAVAAFDRDSARAMLVGAITLAESLHIRECVDLLRITKPTARTDPYAFEHCETTLMAYYRLGRIRDCLAESARLFRIAHHSGRRVLALRALSIQLFIFLEMGDSGHARENFERIQSMEGSSAYVDNALTAFTWNLGDAVGALKLAQRRTGSVKGSPRRDQIHFWGNMAILAAEALDFETMKKARAQAYEIMNPNIDIRPRDTIQLADLWHMCAFEPDAALEEATRQETRLTEEGQVLHAIYMRELRAIALACMGELAQAGRVWQKVRSERGMLGMRLTPRHLSFARIVATGNIRAGISHGV